MRLEQQEQKSLCQREYIYTEVAGSFQFRNERWKQKTKAPQKNVCIINAFICFM